MRLTDQQIDARRLGCLDRKLKHQPDPGGRHYIPISLWEDYITGYHGAARNKKHEKRYQDISKVVRKSQIRHIQRARRVPIA